jgi:hypothetical protein
VIKITRPLLFCPAPKAHLRHSGGIGIIEYRDVLCTSAGKEVVRLYAKPTFIDICGREYDALADSCGKANTDPTLPIVHAHNLAHCFGDKFRCGRLRRGNANSFRNQFSRFCIHNGTLYAGATDINSQGLHISPFASQTKYR